MHEPEILEIDGSVMEGGGQILRISISLSAILGIPVKITKIRAGRSKPGLARQHLTGIELVAYMCQAKVKGVTLGSTEIEFWPGKIQGGHYTFDIQTAGSISLLLQAALPCALFADGPVSMELKGGTNADMAPQVDYMIVVFRHILNKFGADYGLHILRRGFFPKGGGIVEARIDPVRVLKSVNFSVRGDVKSIDVRCFLTGYLPLHLARRSAERARSVLRDEGAVNMAVYREEQNYAPDNGHSIMITCETTTGCVLGADGLGRRDKDAGEVGRQAGRALRADLRSGACLDTHAQDQVIIYMVLAKGRSVARVGGLTLHTSTAIHIAELITKVKFEIRNDDGLNLIECTGLGVINKNMSFT